MLALLSPLLGLLGSLLPSLVNVFERKQEISYDIELAKLRMQSDSQNAKAQLDIANVRADASEGESLRSHDMSIDGGKYLNALRASIRPVVTYSFFILFLAVKISAAYVMLKTGQSVPTMLESVWDAETRALFSTIIAFWFGSRVMEKMRYNNLNKQPQPIVTKKTSTTPNSK